VLEGRAREDGLRGQRQWPQQAWQESSATTLPTLAHARLRSIRSG
jgi:hypothetical protein